MNKVVVLGGIAALLIAGSSLTGCTKVDPGNVGVKVSQWGSGSGVQEQTLGVGWHMTGWGSTVYEYPTFTNNYNWGKSTEEGNPLNESVAFQDKNGLTVSADVAIAFRFEPTKAPLLFQKYRTDMQGMINGPLRNAVRNAIVTESSSLGVEEIYGPKKNVLIDAAFKRVANQFAPYGLVVEQLYWSSSIRVPDAVMQQINQKIANEQAALAAKANVETARQNADAAIASAEGKAKAIQIEAQAITTNPAIVQMRAVEAWNGELPTYMSSGAVTPFVNIK